MLETLTASALFFALVAAWIIMPASPKAPAIGSARAHLEPTPA